MLTFHFLGKLLQHRSVGFCRVDLFEECFACISTTRSKTYYQYNINYEKRMSYHDHGDSVKKTMSEEINSDNRNIVCDWRECRSNFDKLANILQFLQHFGVSKLWEHRICEPST
jgi:hypothetical protein